MYCPNCGAPNENNAAFCSSCGSRLSVAAPQDPPVYTEPHAQNYGYAPPSPPAQYYTLPYVRKIGFGEAIKNFFLNYVTFRGRATRSEFWFAYLFVVLVNMVFSMLLGLVLGIFTGLGLMSVDTMSTLTMVLAYIPCLVFLIPQLAICWRRLHDIGRSGGWYFLGLIPIVGAIILIVWYCKDSDADNQYGPRKI